MAKIFNHKFRLNDMDNDNSQPQEGQGPVHWRHYKARGARKAF